METWNRFRPHVEELERRLVPSTLSYSTNWSGYAVTTSAGAVSQVAGSWTVPAVSSNVSGYSSAWVGIDGYNSSSVEQIGTDSDYVNGSAHYYAWYEMYPAGSFNLSLTIKAGDTISASVSYTSPNQFTLSITDVTTGISTSTIQTSSSAKRSSAEWIQEAPSSIGGVLPLANFGTISFSGATATVSGTAGPADNSWSGSTLYQINMVTKTGALEDTTSPLTDSGSPPPSSFSVTWNSSGSGGKGGGHRSANVPLPGPSPTPSLLPAAVAGLTASLQRMPPAFVATQSPILTEAPAVFASPTVPALSAVSATVAPFVQGSANPDGQGDEQAKSPEMSLPEEDAQPVDRGSAPQAEEQSTPQTDQMSAELPGASLEMGQAADATFVDGFWQSAALLEGEQGTLNEGQEGQFVALAGMVLFFAVDCPWASATWEQTGKKQRGRVSFSDDYRR
jgi:hypothetical protein